MKKNLKVFSAVFFLFIGINQNLLAKLNIVATTTDLQALVKEVGQAEVDVMSIAKGTQDAHSIEAKPSYMVKMRDADLVVSHGLELEDAWLVPLINGSHNAKIKKSENGNLELGKLIDPLEVQKGEVTRADGDVHPEGNPHFQFDPERLSKAALFIAERLSLLDKKNSPFYLKNAENFSKKMKQSLDDWKKRVSKTGVQEIVSYHKNFSYLCYTFKLKCSLQLEPKPGIPPTAGHILSVINEMKARQIKLVFIENYYDDSVALKIKNDIPKVKIAKVAVSVLGNPSIKNNFDLIEEMVKTIESSVQHE